MNKTYRSIWNDVRSCFVVVGENARTKGKPASSRNAIAAAVAALFLAPGAVFAACAPPSPVTTALTSQVVCDDTNFTVDSTGSIKVTSAGSTTAVYVSAAPYTSTFSNNGTIRAEVTAGGWDTAYGLYFGGELSGKLTNAGTISAVLGGSSGSAYGAYVSGNLSGTLSNTSAGTISATVTANGNWASAYGVYVSGNVSGTLTNAGTISGVFNGAGAGGSAYGIRVSGGLASTGKLTNSGTISAKATASNSSAYAYGISFGSAGFGSFGLAGSLTNTSTGTISAVANGKNWASAYGIVMNWWSDVGVLTNNGTIRAEAAAQGASAYGISLPIAGTSGGRYVGVTGTVTNTGTISAKATGTNTAAYAYGVYGYSIDGTLTNSGSISAVANGKTWASAYGITNWFDLPGTLTNSGTISAVASAGGASAYGIYFGTWNGLMPAGSLTNSGTISAKATATATYAGAYGLYGNTIDGTLTNSGSISAVANAATWASAYGIYAYGTLSGSLTNSGSISATATGGTGGSAYGVYIGALDGTVNNSGTISATGQGAVPDSSVYSIYASGGTGTINNLAGGVLSGQVYAPGGINLNNAGIIDTRLNGSFVGGNYTQAATGALTVGVLDNLTYGSLAVGGTATLAAGTGIRVNAGAGNTLVAGDVLTNVISSVGAFTMTTVNVADNILAFQFAPSNNGSGVDLTASATGLTSVAAATGGTSGAGAGVVLDTLLANIGSQPAELQDYLYALGGSGTQQGVSNSVAQILPLISGGVTQVALGASQGTNRVVQARQEGNHGRSSGDQFYGDKRFWLKPFGSWADQDDRKGVSGYDATTYGLVVGADADVTDIAARVGVAFGYARSDVDGNSSVARQNADVNTYQLVIYGSHNLDPVTDVNFQVGVGRHDTDGRRRITFGGTSLVAKSDYHSWSRSIGGGLARTMKWSDKTSFTPSLRADYAWISDKSYNESGAGALNLNVGTNRTEQFIVAADGKFAHVLSDQTTLTGNLGVGYDLINDRASITSAMAGAPTAAFTTRGIDSDPWVLRGGAGMVYRTSERTEVTARYDVEGREDFTNQTASVKVRWAF